MKLVFCGTPEFAVPSLEAVLAAGHELALVLTQPDRPSGRGLQTLAPPVKSVALDAGLRVMQPDKIRNSAELRARLEDAAPEAIIVIAYGRLIPPWMLTLPRFGCINVHGSLLPNYRGAAPIQWAVARGETATGVTTMLLDEGLDTGPMLLSRELAIGPNSTAADLYPLLAQMGAELLVETLAGIEAGTIRPVAQDHSHATHAPMLGRDDGRIDFFRSSQEIYNRWRGFHPWPGAWTTLHGKKLTVSRMALAPDPGSGKPDIGIGEVSEHGGRIFAGCVRGSLIELVEVQLEGKRRMAAADFLRGHALLPGTVLGD